MVLLVTSGACKDDAAPATPETPPKNLIERLDRGLSQLSDPVARTQLRSGVAQAYIERTQTSTAKAILATAVGDLAQIARPSEQAELRGQLAVLYGRAQDLAQAKALAASITDRFIKEKALAQLIPELITAQDLPTAETLARSFQDDEARSEAGLAIVKAYVAQKEPREAGKRIARLRGLPSHDEALGLVAIALAEQKSYPAAIDAISRIQNPHWRGLAQLDFALIYARAGKLGLAEQMLKDIESDWLSASGWMELAWWAEERANRRRRAKKFRRKAQTYKKKANKRLEGIREPLILRSVQEDLAERLIARGRYEDALRRIDTLKSAEARRKLAFILLKAYAAQGQWSMTQDLLPDIEKDPVWGDRARVVVAKGLALTDIDQALIIAQRVQAQDEKRKLVGEIAVAQTEASLPLSPEVEAGFDRIAGLVSAASVEP